MLIKLDSGEYINTDKISSVQSVHGDSGDTWTIVVEYLGRHIITDADKDRIVAAMTEADHE